MSNQLITESNERIKGFHLTLDKLSSALERIFSSRKTTLDGEKLLHGRRVVEEIKNQSKEFTGLPQRGTYSIH